HGPGHRRRRRTARAGHRRGRGDAGPAAVPATPAGVPHRRSSGRTEHRMNATPALEARALTKRFGTRTVIDGLDFVVRPGTLTGFLGANGAGKSTTMRLFMGLDRPTAGAALIRGRRIEERPIPRRTNGLTLRKRGAPPARTT